MFNYADAYHAKLYTAVYPVRDDTRGREPEHKCDTTSRNINGTSRQKSRCLRQQSEHHTRSTEPAPADARYEIRAARAVHRVVVVRANREICAEEKKNSAMAYKRVPGTKESAWENSHEEEPPDPAPHLLARRWSLTVAASSAGRAGRRLLALCMSAPTGSAPFHTGGVRVVLDEFRFRRRRRASHGQVQCLCRAIRRWIGAAA
jgi:hypothetical protein